MIKIKPVLTTLHLFAPHLTRIPLADYARMVNGDVACKLTEEELILQACLNQLMHDTLYDGDFKIKYGEEGRDLFMWIALSRFHEDWPVGWPEPKSIPITRGGNQVSREVLFAFEYGCKDLIENKVDTPMGQHVAKYKDLYPSEYFAITVAQVLRNHPYEVTDVEAV